MQDLLIQTVAFDLLIPLIFPLLLKNQAIILATLKTFIYLCNVKCYILLKVLIGKRRD